MPDSVSIVIPTFNRPQWLRHAIESALHQSHAHMEVVVVDDGSATDAARVMAETYPDVRYVRQNNQGPGAARNTGINESAGDFLAFLDDDDWLTPDSVPAKLAVIQAYPDVGFVYSDIFLAETYGKRLGRYYARRGRPMPTGDIYESLLRRNFIPIHAVLWRRSVLEAVGGFPCEPRAVEDWNLLVRAAERTHAQYVDQALGYYRLHRGNMTLNFNRQIHEAGFTQSYIAHSQRFRELRAPFRAGILAAYGREQWLYGDPSLGYVLLQMARQADPASLPPVLSRGLMILGRPFGRWLMRLYRRLRAPFRGQPSASDYFLKNQ
jgi:glycosyltransferase involved in cell wall biosynthesis